MDFRTDSDAFLCEYLADFSAVIITGASSGIGLAFLELLENFLPNARFFNLSRTENAKFAEYGNLAHIPCNLADSVQTQLAFGQISENLPETGKILLINNSGFGGYGLFPEPSLERNLSMIDLNVRALTQLCGLFLPELKIRGGGIINVCSTAAWQPCPRLNVYAATKAYVLSFTMALGQELKPFGVRALCLCPGPTESNFFKAAGFTDRPLPNSFGHKAPQVAAAALRAIAKNRRLKVVGVLNYISSHAAYLLPKTLIVRISYWILSKIRAN